MEDNQQERVRDFISYLKSAKDVVLTNTKNSADKNRAFEQLFALSDVIDESNINCQALISHVMGMFEIIIGKKVEIFDQSSIEELTNADINELQRDIQPLMMFMEGASQ